MASSQLPYGSSDATAARISHFSADVGGKVPGLSKKDTYDPSLYKLEKNHRNLTDNERRTTVRKAQIWGLRNKKANQIGVDNPYSKDYLQDKVDNNEMEPELLAFYLKIYDSISEYANFERFRTFVNNDIDGFVDSFEDFIYQKYQSLIDPYLTVDNKGYLRDSKGRFYKLRAIKSWVLEEGYMYLANDFFEQKVVTIRDAVLACKTIDEARESFGPNGTFFTENNVIAPKGQYNDSRDHVSDEWSQYVNYCVFTAFSTLTNKMDKINKESLSDKAYKIYVPFKFDERRLVYNNHEYGVLLVDDEQLGGHVSSNMLKQYKKDKLYCPVSYSSYLKLKGSIRDSYAVLNTELNRIEGINLPSKGEAQAFSRLVYKGARMGGEEFRDRFYLTQLTRNGINYRPDGTLNGHSHVKPDFKGNQGVIEQGDNIKFIGLLGESFGNEVPGSRASEHSEQQEHNDWIYDSFRDIATVLGVDVKSITSKLYMTIGARCKRGQLANCEAYFFDAESKSRMAVVNLSRFKGMGSLAHELFHYFDHVLCDNVLGEGKAIGFLGADREYCKFLASRGLIAAETYNTDMLTECYRNIDSEKFPATYALMESFYRTNTKFYKNAEKLDANRKNAYYTLPAEMFARAGAIYLKDKLAEVGKNMTGEAFVNDYLCGNAEACATNGLKQAIPVYPEGEERKELYNLFDNFFEEAKNLGFFKRVEQPDLSSLNCQRTGVETFVTGNVEHVVVPLIASGLSNSPKSDTLSIDFDEIANDISAGETVVVGATDPAVIKEVIDRTSYDKNVITTLSNEKTSEYLLDKKSISKKELTEIRKHNRQITTKMDNLLGEVAPIDFANFSYDKVKSAPEQVLFGE